jgi:hypothetical protein
LACGMRGRGVSLLPIWALPGLKAHKAIHGNLKVPMGFKVPYVALRAKQ